MKKVEFTSEEIHEIENYVIKAFERRAQVQGYEGKKLLDMQGEFVLGMVSALDSLSGAETTGKSTISPRVAFSFVRNETLVVE
jgi:hypothetical protein